VRLRPGRRSAAHDAVVPDAGAAPARAAADLVAPAEAAVAVRAARAKTKQVWAVVAVVVASRLLVLMLGGLTFAVATTARRPLAGTIALKAGGSLFAQHSALGLLFGPWTNWDASWFISIASHGYVRPGSPAFLPLYPLTMRALAPLTGGRYAIAGVLLSLLFFGVACVLLYKLVAEEFSPRAGLWAVVFLSVFPTSFYFQAVYSESLFLLASLACFLWSRRGRWWLAGLAGAAATLTRDSGLLLLVPLALYYLHARKWRLRSVDAHAGSLLLLPAALGIYMAYLAVHFGRPLYFAQAEAGWGRRLTFPLLTIYRGTLDFAHAAHGLLFSPGGKLTDEFTIVAFAALVALLGLIVLGWRRLPAPYTAYAALTLLVPLCFPTPTPVLTSLARFVLVAFPLYIVLALVAVRRPRLGLALAFVSLAGLCWLTVEFALRQFVA
jgi:hypothetical protein